jgi:hypothetical protein
MLLLLLVVVAVECQGGSSSGYRQLVREGGVVVLHWMQQQQLQQRLLLPVKRTILGCIWIMCGHALQHHTSSSSSRVQQLWMRLQVQQQQVGQH